MEGENSLLGHFVVHNTEDTLLHFTSVLGTQDDNLVVLEVNLDTGFSGQILDREGSLELTSIENVEVDFLIIAEILSKLLRGRSDKHVLHEESVIRSAANDSDFKSVFRIPSSISIDDIKLEKKTINLSEKINFYQNLSEQK